MVIRNIILRLINQNHKITIDGILKKTKTSKEEIQRVISKLKIENYLKRIGADKNSHWGSYYLKTKKIDKTVLYELLMNS